VSYGREEGKEKAKAAKAVRFYSIKDEIRILGIDDGPFDLHRKGKALIGGCHLPGW